MLFTDLSTERIVRALRKVGFQIVQEGKHIGMSDGFHRVTIPRHKRLNPFTVQSIIRYAGLMDKKFKELLK